MRYRGDRPRLRALPPLLTGVCLAPTIALLALTTAPPASAFGTVNAFGQRAEHERITRAALACPEGGPSDDSCFEPRSLDQLAGRRGTFGAVGVPDLDETFELAAHCDDADFSSGSYPRTRDQATAQPLACVAHLRDRFARGVRGAGAVVDGQGRVAAAEVDLTADCTFLLGIPGRAKCDAIEGLGRALHGAQDFYSHSNWSDTADPSQPVGLGNPPGLHLPAPSPVLDLAGTGTPAVPPQLSTGCFTVPDLSPGVRGCQGRITHAALTKDLGLIDPGTGGTSDPWTPRGRVGANFAEAVRGAITDIRRQWADLRRSLEVEYGAARGRTVVCALTRDDPVRACGPATDARTPPTPARHRRPPSTASRSGSGSATGEERARTPHQPTVDNRSGGL